MSIATLRRRSLLWALWVFALPGARALDRPQGSVVLTVGKATFDMAMLERMKQRSIRTATPWYDSAREFTGPLLRDVLAARDRSRAAPTFAAQGLYFVGPYYDARHAIPEPADDILALP